MAMMAMYIPRGVLLKYRSRTFGLEEVSLPFEIRCDSVRDADPVARDRVICSGAVFLRCMELGTIRIFLPAHVSLPGYQGD
jgi:hypothetical protein